MFSCYCLLLVRYRSLGSELFGGDRSLVGIGIASEGLRGVDRDGLVLSRFVLRCRGAVAWWISIGVASEGLRGIDRDGLMLSLCNRGSVNDLCRW
jgi:hypothetical protein